MTTLCFLWNEEHFHLDVLRNYIWFKTLWPGNSAIELMRALILLLLIWSLFNELNTGDLFQFDISMSKSDLLDKKINYTHAHAHTLVWHPKACLYLRGFSSSYFFFFLHFSYRETFMVSETIFIWTSWSLLWNMIDLYKMFIIVFCNIYSLLMPILHPIILMRCW